MKRVSIALVALVAASLIMVACSSYSNPSSQPTTSQIALRAFISNPLQPSVGSNIPVLNIVNAATDQFSAFTVNLTGVVPQPGLMAVSPNRKFTSVFSTTGSSNVIAIVGNETEAPALSITLPGLTESMFVWIDNATVFTAVPSAPVSGLQQGAVLQLNLSLSRISATIPVPSAHYVVPAHDGNRILAFGDNQDAVTIISPSLIGTSADPRTLVCPDGTPAALPDASLCDPNAPKVFDRPVWAVFSGDDSLAYIMNCGPECGGTTASITVLDMNTNTATVTLPVNAATYGLLQGNSLFVAGTPAGTTCTSGTAAPNCGQLTEVDVLSMTVSRTAEITNGYHNRMEMGANAQLFIGAKTCTNITTTDEVRGCLSIFNTATSKVFISQDNGDVTGIAPIPNRQVVYVVEDGELFIYDTTTDQKQSDQISIIGQANDVKVVDF